MTNAFPPSLIEERVILDACVLFPASLRDLLLRSHADTLYLAFWTDEILEELERNLINKQQLPPEKVQRLIQQLKVVFPDSIVEGHHTIIDQMTNHVKDRHVLAAAVTCQASCIVTFNIRDFPLDSLAPYNIVVQEPDSFFIHLWEHHPHRLRSILEEQVHALKHPPKSFQETLDTLAQHVPNFVQAIRQDES